MELNNNSDRKHLVILIILLIVGIIFTIFAFLSGSFNNKIEESIPVSTSDTITLTPEQIKIKEDLIAETNSLVEKRIQLTPAQVKIKKDLLK